MKLCTYQVEGNNYLGIFQRGSVYDLNGSYELIYGKRNVFPNDMISLLEDRDRFLHLYHLNNHLEESEKELQKHGIVRSEDKVRLCAPISRPRKNIVCLGVNYGEHAEETKHDIPKFPVFFTKPPSVVIGPYDAIILPKSSKQIDYEAELAFVFSKKGKNIPEEKAWDYVAGYMAMNDVTARDLQHNHQQWFKGKGLDTFGPMGPYLVTKDEVPDPHRLRLTTTLNGKPMQDSNTRNLIFKVPALVAALSLDMTVDVGDIVSTGTPSGVGHVRKPPVYMKDGDIVEVEVEGIGVLRNKVVE